MTDVTLIVLSNLHGIAFPGLTSCQLQAYVAESNNIFKDTSLFVVQCKPDGEYLPRQVLHNYIICD